MPAAICVSTEITRHEKDPRTADPKLVKGRSGLLLGHNANFGINVRIGSFVMIEHNVSADVGAELEDNIFSRPSIAFTPVLHLRSNIPRQALLSHTGEVRSMKRDRKMYDGNGSCGVDNSNEERLFGNR